MGGLGAVGEKAVLTAYDAAGQIDRFTGFMGKVGQEAAKLAGEADKKLLQFAEGRVDWVSKTTTTTIEGARRRFTETVDKARIRLEPAGAAIARERANIRTNTAIWTDKLGILAEHAGELGAPFVNPILEWGRDARDSAMGFTAPKVEALRAFGRQANSLAEKAIGSVVSNLQERWAALRQMSNESRTRVNGFLESALGKGARGFARLKESAVVKAVDKLNFTPEEFRAAWKGLVEKSREKVPQFFENVANYCKSYAVDRWRQTGLDEKAIGRRLKLMGAQGAASMGRAATIGAAAGMEGAVLASRVVRDPRGRAMLGVAAMTVLAVTQPGMIEHVRQVVGHLDFGNLAQSLSPDHLQATMQGLFPPDAHASNAAGSFGVDVGHVAPVHADIASPFGGVDVGSAAAPVTPDGVVTVPTPEAFVAPIVGPEVISPDLISQLVPGQPLEPQALRLAQDVLGNGTEAFHGLLRNGFFGNIDNFRVTAQAIIDGANYTPLEKAIAANQLNAINILQNNPGIDLNSDTGLTLIRQAAHYWRP